jgi:hypothetical protein
MTRNTGAIRRAPLPSSDRDLRLDFFRGLALLFIFVDHIPSNAAAWFTVRNFGFSDAAEIFVFLSGYCAALAYEPRIRRHGLIYGAASTLHRAWRIYVAHVFVLIVSIVLVLLVAEHFQNPAYLEQMNLGGFQERPAESLLQSLLLRFRAGNMDVLPLYVLLLSMAAPMLALMRRWPGYVLAASALLWMSASRFNWNLGTYPEGGAWLFNPFCWQFLFVIGSACAIHRQVPARLIAWRRWLQPVAAAYLLGCLALVMTWRIPGLEAWVPDALARAIYPISKSNLDILRLLHFLSLAYVIAVHVPYNSSWLAASVSRAVIRCGRHSLAVFCLGIVLAFIAHVLLMEVNGSIASQYVVSAGGCLMLIGAAAVLDWYQQHSSRTRTGIAIPASSVH